MHLPHALQPESLNFLKEPRLTPQGKHVVVLGRSLIVGKPVGMLLLQKGFPVMPPLLIATHERQILLITLDRRTF